MFSQASISLTILKAQIAFMHGVLLAAAQNGR